MGERGGGGEVKSGLGVGGGGGGYRGTESDSVTESSDAAGDQ